MEAPLRFGVSFGQHDYTWDELVRQVQLAEQLGFDHVWIYDHFVGPRKKNQVAGTPALYEPALEAWTLLAGLAAVTTRIRLGTKVTSTTYRNPALLAKQATTVDHISHGRLILGLGAGWHEDEHRMYGYAFPEPGERVDRFAEAVTILDGLMRQERTTVLGEYYRVDDAPFEPKPVQQPRIPLLIGTRGRRMIRLVAQYADMWDTGGTDEEVADLRALLHERCGGIGRNPQDIRLMAQAEPQHLVSADAFEAFVLARRQVGFVDFVAGVPDPTSTDVLEEIAESLVRLRSS